MDRERHVEAKLIVPIQPEDGSNKLSSGASYRYRLKELDRLLAKHFGGFTRLYGYGAWYDYKGVGLVTEHVRVYLLAFTENCATCDALDSLRDWVKEKLEQKAVYLSYTYVEEYPIQ